MENTQNKYAVPVDALERSAHVPLDEQIEDHPEPPTPGLVSEEQRQAQGRNWIVGAGAVAAPAMFGGYGGESDSGCD